MKHSPVFPGGTSARVTQKGYTQATKKEIAQAQQIRNDFPDWFDRRRAMIQQDLWITGTGMKPRRWDLRVILYIYQTWPKVAGTRKQQDILLLDLKNRTGMDRGWWDQEEPADIPLGSGMKLETVRRYSRQATDEQVHTYLDLLAVAADRTEFYLMLIDTDTWLEQEGETWYHYTIRQVPERLKVLRPQLEKEKVELGVLESVIRKTVHPNNTDNQINLFPSS